MSQGLQTSINARTTDGVTYVGAGNTNVGAFNSMQSGPTAPSTGVLGTLWLDTSNGSLPAIRMNDGIQWVNCIVVDASNHRPRFILDADLDTYIEGTGVDGGGRIVSESAQIVGISSSGLSIGTATPAVSIDCAGRTDAIQLPAGPDSSAPAPTAGRMRWSTTSSSIKVANGTAWGALTGSGSGVASLGSIPGVTLTNQLSGQALVATGGTNWVNGTIGSAGIGTGVVGSTHLAAGAVTHAALGTRVVEGENVASGTLLTSHLGVTGSAASVGQIPTAQADGSVAWVSNAYNNTRRIVGGYSIPSGRVGYISDTVASAGLTEIHINLSELQFRNAGNPLAARGFTRLRFNAPVGNQSSRYEWSAYWSNFSAGTRNIDDIVIMGPRAADTDYVILLGHQNHNQYISARIILRLLGGAWNVFANISRRTTSDADMETLMGAFTLPSGAALRNFEVRALNAATTEDRTYSTGRIDYAFLYGT